MSALPGDLEASLSAAETAAGRFDVSSLERAVAALGEAHAALAHGELSPAELDRLRGRVARFRDLCAFLGSVLHGALRQAGDPGTPRYADHGQPLPSDTRPLVGRYG